MKPVNALVAWMVDIRLGLRLMLRRPLFSAAIVLHLALGIGATTAIFSVVNGVLLRKLPYPEPDRLMTVRTHHRGSISLNNSGANFLDYRDQIESIESVAAFAAVPWHLGDTTDPRHLTGVFVTHEFFPTLGTEPLVGRVFTVDDERPDANVAVIRFSFWQSHFGGIPDIVGRNVTLDGQPYAVVGVMPADFHFLNRQAEVWRPVWLNPGDPSLRANHNLRVVCRLANGVTSAEAQGEFATYGERVARQFPQFY